MEAVLPQRKTIRITGKRQITIPQRFFEALGFGSEAVCELQDDRIVLRPARMDGEDEFADLLLADLIDQGLSGKELLDAFRAGQADLRSAARAMIEDADRAAAHPDRYASMGDVFGDSR